MREREMKVQLILPAGTEIIKLKKKSLISHIYIGKPLDPALGNATRIQLNDVLGTDKNIGEFVELERKKLPEVDRKKMTVSLKVDVETKMGIVFDFGPQLQDKFIRKLLNKDHTMGIAHRETGHLEFTPGHR